MNKVISTHHRVFMCICGSSGSGKTNLTLDIVSQNKETGGFLNPGFHKVVYYYKYWQPIYNLFNQNLLNHQSVNSGFQTTVGNEKVLAVFDDSCDEILIERRFCKLGHSG